MNDTTRVTLELRDLVENSVDIWDFDYPSYYKGDQKKAFEQKVIDHFYFRQIGCETVGQFKHRFKTKMREIMPLYLNYYRSVELFESIEDPLQSYELTEEYIRTTSGQGSDSSTSSSSGTNNVTGTNTETGTSDTDATRRNESLDRFSDTPQGTVTNINEYLTEARSIEGEETNNQSTTDTRTGSTTSKGTSSESASTSGTSESSGTEEYTLHRFGNIGVQPLGDELKKLRDSYIDVDMMIINELSCLFLKIY